MKKLPSLVIKLGILSLFTDMSSEMIFPLLPLFIASLPGGGPLALGIIEGIAESTAAFFKLLSGFWTDKVKKRAPFVIFGYSLAGLVRPLIGFAGTVWFVLAMRFLDRIGKGLRGSPRDAMIADTVPPERRGAAFGFQRVMDHSGAVAGPIIAAILMSFFGFTVRQVIFAAIVPSIVVIILVLTLKEPSKTVQTPTVKISPEIGKTSSGFGMLVAAVFIFTLGNSSDAFLLLRLSEAGIKPHFIPILWSLHHVLKIAGAWLGGNLSDIFGRKLLMITGLALYAAVYLLFGTVTGNIYLVSIFILYGASIGILEPTESAWVSELSHSDKRGAAFGIYNAAKGFGALPASLIFGLLWKEYGYFTAFTVGAVLASVSMLTVFFINGKNFRTS